MIEVVYRKGLLLDSVTLFLQLLQRLLPALVMPHERVLAQRVVDALDVHLGQFVDRQAIVDDIIRRHPEESGPQHAEKFVDVGGVARIHLQRPIDVADAIRIAVDEGGDRPFGFKSEASQICSATRSETWQNSCVRNPCRVRCCKSCNIFISAPGSTP